MSYEETELRIQQFKAEWNPPRADAVKAFSEDLENLLSAVRCGVREEMAEEYKAEIRRLNREAESYKREFEMQQQDLVSVSKQRDARIEASRVLEYLGRWGEHRAGCPCGESPDLDDCDCGLNDVIEELAA